MTLTTFLATWGALLATAGFGWNLYRDVIDRARLRLNVRVRRIAVSATGAPFVVAPDMQLEASNELYVVMTIMNVGRRPTMWQGWGGKYRVRQSGKSGFFITGARLPVMLRESETHTEMTLLEADLSPVNENVDVLYAWDVAGREYRASRRKMKQLRREAIAATTNRA